MKLDPQVYERAAARIKRGASIGCCDAIRFNFHIEAFADIFKPKGASEFWRGVNQRNESRIIALLLMAEIVRVEQGDKQ